MRERSPDPKWQDVDFDAKTISKTNVVYCGELTAIPEFVTALKSQPGNDAVLDAITNPFEALYHQTVHEKPIAFGVLNRIADSVARNDERLKRTLEYNRAYVRSSIPRLKLTEYVYADALFPGRWPPARAYISYVHDGLAKRRTRSCTSNQAGSCAADSNRQSDRLSSRHWHLQSQSRTPAWADRCCRRAKCSAQ